MTTEDKKPRCPKHDTGNGPCYCHLKAEDRTENMPEELVLMPSQLTAENGAKYLLIGEFNTKFEEPCPDCDGGEHRDLETDRCGTCDDTGIITITTPIEWTTIKEIYAMVVNKFSKSGYSQAELDRRVAEAEERQRDEIANMFSGDFAHFREMILNAGGKGDE